MQQSLVQALGIINCSIIKRLKPGQFEVLHTNPDWIYALIPEAKDQNTFTFAGNSPYLEDFLIDAEDFWQIGNDGQIQSGIWTEQADELLLRLEAIAAVSKGECYLIINNLQEEYNRQRKTLQAARELLISNDKIMAEQEYIQERLEHVLSQNLTLQCLQEPVKQVINNAEFGVMITDSHFKPIDQNPKAFELFELQANQGEEPVELVMSLFKNQFPEHKRVIQTHSQFTGELFWHKPTHINKWFQITMYPVANETKKTNNWVILLSDVTRIKYLLQRNESLSLRDHTTNLPNRQSFWQGVEQAIEKRQRFFILYMDIKHFKRVNDMYGHHVGDQLLLDLGQRLQPIVGDNNLLARIGGNEFGMILHDAKSQEECETYIKRLIETVELPFYTEQQNKIQISLNVGAAHYPLDACDSDELMRFADMAMFNAKKSANKQIAFYSKALKEASLKRLALEESLQKAIEDEQFELYLQPIMDMQSGKIVKAEALIRWHDSTGKLISPDDFIPLAEQTGQIIPIGKWVISRAGEMLKVLNKYNSNLCLSINLSPKQISDRHLLEFIQKMIVHCGIDARQLALELTEGVLIENFDRVQKLLNDVRKLGISISIDDFGTGYSSLRYLQKLPIDYLKIDRSFVRHLDSNENDKALILAIIGMAQSLKLAVIAEGVETIEQQQFLQEHHCFAAQGYLFGKPVPFDDFCKLLVSSPS